MTLSNYCHPYLPQPLWPGHVKTCHSLTGSKRQKKDHKQSFTQILPLWSGSRYTSQRCTEQASGSNQYTSSTHTRNLLPTCLLITLSSQIYLHYNYVFAYLSRKRTTAQRKQGKTDLLSLQMYKKDDLRTRLIKNTLLRQDQSNINNLDS